MNADPTGHRYILNGPNVSAEITEVGAALRALRVAGVDLVPPYPDDRRAPAASGVVLVPWPNRIRDGRWVQRGTTYQLAISEPALGNASHGLLRFTPYRPVETEPHAITLAATVFPQTGYPFQLETSVRYAVTSDGLEATHTIVNAGDADAPVALGTHPYLFVSDTPTADLSVQVDAEEWFPLDERNLPISCEPVDAAHDLREPRRVGDLSLDTAYTSIARDADDRVRGVLRTPDGRQVELWAGTGFDYLQLFTTDRYPGQDLAIAIEPMTAPADAFNSGRDLRWLAPGESWQLEWGITFGPSA